MRWYLLGESGRFNHINFRKGEGENLDEGRERREKIEM